MPSRSILALVLLCCSCVSYDFEPVVPVLVGSTVVTITPNVGAKPDLFLVVDKSGSMSFGVEQAGCSCPAGGCPAGCPTRWTELRSAMGTFLGAQGAGAHLGMVPFPRDGVCGGSLTSDVSVLGVDLDQSVDANLTAMQATAAAIKSRIDAISPQGGTPTSASLTSLLSYDPLVKDALHPRFVLLLTDGLPNCNAANDPQLTTCTCTLANPPASGCSVLGTNQCLDDSGTVAAIQQLKARGVTTIVLGFGAETKTGLGPTTLDLLGRAGGFERTCQADSECGAGDTCSVTGTTDACGKPTRACAQHFYQAGNAAELGKALDAIRAGINCSPCSYALTERPSDPRLISVQFDGRSMPRDQVDTWVYDSASNKINFQGAACANLTSGAPAKLEFGLLQVQ